MKQLIGLLLILCGICLGLYLGGYVMFFGGIVQIVNTIQHGVVATQIACGILRIVFAAFVGWVSAFVLMIPGFALMSDN